MLLARVRRNLSQLYRKKWHFASSSPVWPGGAGVATTVRMPRFRPRPGAARPAAVPDLLSIGQLVDELMQPGHFFVAPGLRLRWTMAKTEDVPWEIFRGRLLDAAQTRRQA